MCFHYFRLKLSKARTIIPIPFRTGITVRAFCCMQILLFQQLHVAQFSLFSPCCRNEFPQVQGFWRNAVSLFNRLHQVVSQILVSTPDNAFIQILSFNAGTFRQQVSTAISAIRVNGTAIRLLQIKRRVVSHTFDADFSPVGLLTSTV